MFGNFEEEARKVLVMAKKEMHDLKHPYVSSEHLLLAILKLSSEISDKLKEYDLDYNSFKAEIICPFLYSIKLPPIEGATIAKTLYFVLFSLSLINLITSLI